MDHLDEDLLGLMALGERPANDEEALHLASCRQCASLLAALQHTVFVATVNPDQVELETPGSHNWTAIHTALGLSPALAEDPLRRRTAGTAGTAAGAVLAGDGGARSDVPAATGFGPRAGRRPGPRLPRRAPWILGVAAGVLLGAAGAWTALTVLGPTEPPVAAPTTPQPTAVVLGEAALAPLAGHSARGSAVVEKLPDGTRQLVIDLPEEQLQGFREVWVGSADLSRMVSLGVLGPGPRAFVIPGGLNLSDYPVLDISNEPYDGDPAHSADSIARGTFAERG